MGKARSIRTELIRYAVIIFIVFVVAMWCIYQYVFSRYVEEEASRNVELLVQQTDKAVESSLSMIESSVEYFFMDKTLQEWISMESPDPNEELLGKLNMDEAIQHSLLTNSAWEKDLISSAYFYVDQFAFTFYSNGTLPIHELTQQVKQISARMQLEDSKDMLLFLPQDEMRTFFIGKSYVDEERPDRSLNLIIAVDERKLMEEYEVINQYKDAQAYLADKNGNIYSSVGETFGNSLGAGSDVLYTDGDVREVSMDGKDYYIFGDEVSQTGLWLIVKIPKDSYGDAMIRIVRQYVLIVCLVLAGILAVGLFVIYKGTAFLSTIEKKFVAVKNGDYTAKLPDFNTSELHELSMAFNGMTDQINYLIHEVYEKNLEVKKAELGFLQSQINPHFLFNTFAAIGTKAKLAGQEEIYRMVRAISTLLEAGFRPDNNEVVGIRQELDYVECYLYIQKERFGNKLKYSITVEDERLLDSRIPRLCLEPIVENAVIHGIEPKVSGGTVSITISKAGTTIYMTVEDDGTGFSGTQKSKSGNSIGIQNTDKRLKLMYGEKYGVFVDHDMKRGARVTVKVPFERGGEHV